MGSGLAHENEAPFPESLVEPFVLCYCPPDGIVLDPFSGSGTTAATAIKNNRHFYAIDIRESQCELTRRRVEEARREVARGENNTKAVEVLLVNEPPTCSGQLPLFGVTP